MSRYARKIDDNQKDIVSALRSIGALVAVTSAAGDGFPDLVVGYRGRVYLLEVKDGNKPPSRQSLTPDQEAFHEKWSGYVSIVNSPESAIKAVTVND